LIFPDFDGNLSFLEMAYTLPEKQLSEIAKKGKWPKRFSLMITRKYNLAKIVDSGDMLKNQ